MHNLTSERTIYTQNNSAQNKYAELNLLDFGQNFITRKTIISFYQFSLGAFAVYSNCILLRLENLVSFFKHQINTL
jgi:hypothetical protein